MRQESIPLLLTMSDSRWSAITQESLRVLEHVMRTPVRADNLEFVKNDISSQVSLTFNEQDAALITEFVTAHIVPNSQYSQDLTTASSTGCP